MSLDAAGVACPVCGGGCVGFPDVVHRADYPFLPGGVEAPMSDKTSDERLFDSNGQLAVPEGGVVPEGVDLFTHDGKPYGKATTAAQPKAAKAAEESAKRAPKREKR